MEKEEFTLDDGDFVECVWQNEKPKDDRPIVLLFHGLEGSVHSPYMTGIMNAFSAKGFASVLMHFRSCGEKVNLKPRAYHSGDTADAKAWIEEVQSRHPNSTLHAVGFSIGGNMLLKLLGEYKEHSPIASAVSISAPMRLDICADTIEKGFSKMYENYLLKSLKTTLLEKYKRFNMQELIGINESQVANIKSIREFDDAYTAPMHGYSSSVDYYNKCSAKSFLKDIRIKTLIIHAIDDPFMTDEILPNADEISSFITLDVSAHGGHVGFVAGSFREPVYWLEGRVLEFLKL